MKHFSDWTIQDAQRAIAEVIESTVGQRGYDANHAFIEQGDHWQNGDGWVGPGREMPPGPAREELLERIRPQFTPVDATREALDRSANGLMLREADLAFVAFEPAEDGTAAHEAEQAAAEDLREEVGIWWDRVKLWSKARKAYIRSRWAGRGALRLMIAPGSLIDAGDGSPALPEFDTLWEALEHVQLDAPLPGACFVHTDPDTLDQVAITMFKRDGRDWAELCYVDHDTGETVIRQVGPRADDATEVRIDMGGMLPVIEMEAPVLITESVRALQRKLNYEASLHLRTSETAGFPERYVSNAEPEGEWRDYPPADGDAGVTQELEDGTTLYLHPRPRTLGASISTELRGIEGEDGKPVTPTVTFRDPTDPAFVAAAAEFTRAQLLRICRQGHAVGGDTAEASGVAYQQARADFENDLGGVKGELEALVRNTVEAAIAMAEAMMRRPATPVSAGETTIFLPASAESVLDSYRAVVTCYVNAGPITPDEQRAILEKREQGVISLEDTLAQLGVEDVDAALARRNADPYIANAILSEQLDTLKKAMEISEGAVRVVAARLGFTPDEVSALLRVDWDGIER